MLFTNKNQRVGRSASIVYNENGDSPQIESYNRLRDNILYYCVDGKNKVIQVESTISGEAKTTTACNLAVCLGQGGKKVCIVDLDFRKPRVHRAFEVENENGISDYFLDKLDYNHVIKPTQYQNVSVVTRGSEVDNTIILLTSERMKELFSKLRSDFDFIIVDCPPVLLISDYIHISQLSDGVLFVVAYGKTKKKQVTEAINQLRMNNINIIGTALTFYDPKKSNSYGEYKYYNYYGYGEGQKK